MNQSFTTEDFAHSSQEDAEFAIKILNSLTEDQKRAVHIYAASRYDEGNDSGYERGQHVMEMIYSGAI